MTPLLTLDPLPTLDAAGAEVRWSPALLASLQSVVQSTVALTSRLSAEKGANAVACWYQAPGSADALPVDALEHFVRAPYFVGCYYVRIVVGGEMRYHRCTPTEGGDNNSRAFSRAWKRLDVEALLPAGVARGLVVHLEEPVGVAAAAAAGPQPAGAAVPCLYHHLVASSLVKTPFAARQPRDAIQ